MAASQYRQYRQYREYQSIRFEPEDGDLAHICTDPDAAVFQPDLTAEILNESHTGCGLVIPDTDELPEGARCIARVGRLSPMRAIVVWRGSGANPTELRIGLRYEE